MASDAPGPIATAENEIIAASAAGAPEVQAQAPKEAETPAAVRSETLPIPAGSPIEIVRESIPQPAPAPDQPAPPPREVETIRTTPAAATAWQVTRAESGTARAPDRRAELRYPSPAALCGLASAGFFTAWQVAAVPAWVWALAAAAVATAAGLYFGHERGARAVTAPA